VKKFLTASLFVLLALAPWACDKYYPAGPLPSPTPTPSAGVTLTPTNTPSCGLTVVTLPLYIAFPPIPQPTQVVIATVVPTVTPGVWAYPTPTPDTVTTHVPFDGYVIQNLTQWQTYFGTAAPPVNFSTQMILVYVASLGCPGGQTITNACVTSTEIDLSVTIIPAVPCNWVGTTLGAIALPQSSLPIYSTLVTYP
jgi:hypothetical protein